MDSENSEYLYEGKAPSLELQSIFQRVREWLNQYVFDCLKDIQVYAT